MPTTVGLYYPFIHFRDDAWVKLAALYWDRLARIVPKDFQTHDSPTVQQLNDELSLVWNEPPGPETRIVGKKFVALLEQHEDAVRRRYGLHRMIEWEPDPQTVQRARWRNVQLAYIYNPKLWQDLTSQLVGLGLAQSEREESGEWIGMHPRLANVYMSALAEQMARDRYLSPLADDAVTHLAAGGWSMERLAMVLLEEPTEEPVVAPAAHTLADVEQGLAHVALESVVPDNMQSVTVDQIVKARKELHAERLAFQERLHHIVQDEAWLQQIADPGTYDRQLRLLYENELKPHLDRMEKDMSLMGIPTRRGLISVLGKAPKFAIEAAKTFGWVVHPAFSVAATIAGAIIPRLGPKDRSPKDDQSQPLAYLLDVRKALTPGKLSERLMTRANRAVVGVLTPFGHDS